MENKRPFKTIYTCFPQGKHKVLTMSYDDGKIFDRKLIEIFNKYGIKGTFHLNTGIMPVDEDRIQLSEVKELYKGHEVSCHTSTHPTIERCPLDQVVQQVIEDRKALEDAVGYPVRGLSYPNGSYSKDIINLLPACGIEYSRVVGSTDDFAFPDNFLEWKSTCHHGHNLMQNAERFADLHKTQYLYMMYVWGMAEYAREEINAVGGYYAFGKELCNGDSVFDFDTTKLSVHTLDIGLAGIEVYDILRDEYDIQIEFGDIGNILAYLSIGDRPQEVERLVSALAEIKRRYRTDGSGLLSQEYIDPVVAASPQEAFYAPKKSLPLRETEGMVCSEFVMCYPPGIPILAPGERITKEILNYIEYAKAKGCSMTGPEDPEILHLNVLA